MCVCMFVCFWVCVSLCVYVCPCLLVLSAEILLKDGLLEKRFLTRHGMKLYLVTLDFTILEANTTSKHPNQVSKIRSLTLCFLI